MPTEHPKPVVIGYSTPCPNTSENGYMLYEAVKGLSPMRSRTGRGKYNFRVRLDSAAVIQMALADREGNAVLFVASSCLSVYQTQIVFESQADRSLVFVS